jgi:hypothetical protein
MIRGQPQGVETHVTAGAPQGPRQVGGEPQAARQQADHDGVIVDPRRDGLRQGLDPLCDFFL